MKTVEIKLCPFRTYTEAWPVITVGMGDITVVTGFMDCLKGKCPAWYSETERIPGTGVEQEVEHCRRLA